MLRRACVRVNAARARSRSASSVLLVAVGCQGPPRGWLYATRRPRCAARRFVAWSDHTRDASAAKTLRERASAVEGHAPAGGASAHGAAHRARSGHFAYRCPPRDGGHPLRAAADAPLPHAPPRRAARFPGSGRRRRLGRSHRRGGRTIAQARCAPAAPTDPDPRRRLRLPPYGTVAPARTAASSASNRRRARAPIDLCIRRPGTTTLSRPEAATAPGLLRARPRRSARREAPARIRVGRASNQPGGRHKIKSFPSPPPLSFPRRVSRSADGTAARLARAASSPGGGRRPPRRSRANAWRPVFLHEPGPIAPAGSASPPAPSRAGPARPILEPPPPRGPACSRAMITSTGRGRRLILATLGGPTRA
jgi:hypothetical protein